MLEQEKTLLRDIHDFPKKGIVFKDITPMLASPGALSAVCDELSRPFQDQRISKVLAIESRGFFFGTGIAERLGVGFVPVRKAGKLPWSTVKQAYQLEYGEAVIEIHQDAVSLNERVLLVDDVLATGGTLRAAKALVEQLGGVVVGVSCLLELEFLKGRQQLGQTLVHTVWSV